MLNGRNRVWVVLAREWYFDPHGELPTALARLGTLRLVAQPAGTRIFAWERSATGGAAHGG